MIKRNYIKRLTAALCIFSLISSLLVSPVTAEETTKFNYKLGMDSDSLFDTMYGYSGGTSESPAQPNLSKSYVEGKYGKALQITYHGFKINNPAKRYNAYLFKFKQSDITVGGESMKMLDLMRDTNTISMYVHTPQTVDHTGSGAAASRTVEMIFEFNSTGGNKKYSKKFQLPNTGEWAYISLPTSVFAGNGTNMKDGIQDESYTSLVSMSFSFPYKDYFGANPDDSTWETPWDEPLIIDELLFDRSTDTETAVNPPSAGEEAYHENAEIKALYTDGSEVTGFDKNKEINEVPLPGYIKPEEISSHFTVVPEAEEIKKTNTQQAVSGATYELSLPQQLPGQGSVTVTSASGKAKKIYKLKFTLRDGLRVLKDKISGDISSSVTIPVINESASVNAKAAVIMGITDKESGALIRACTSEEKSIDAGQTVDFTVNGNVNKNENAQIFVVNNLSELKPAAPPFTIPYAEIGTSASMGELSGVSVSFSERSGVLNISASAESGGGLIAVKSGDKIIGVRAALVKDGKINEDILIGSENSGEMSAVIVFGNSRAERNFYNASDEEISGCIEAYKSLTAENAIEFYKKYGKVLSVPSQLWDMLSEQEQISVLTDADKDVTDIEEVRTAVGRTMVLQLVNRCDDEILKMLFGNYNDILGFDTSATFYGEYVRSNVSKVLDMTAKKRYDSLEAADRAFFENGFIYAVNSVSNYAEIGKLIEENAERIGNAFNYAKYNALTTGGKTEYLSYVSKKQITSITELNSMLSEYETKNPSLNVSGKGDGSGTVIPSDSSNAQAQNENSFPAQKTVFSDVPPSHWAYNAVQALYVLKIADGVSDGVFGTDYAVTREQFVKLLLGAAAIDNDETVQSGFNDVDKEQWYAPYINAAVQAGIVSGITENEFGVGMSITREDMAVLIARTLMSKGVSLPQNQGEKFSDDSDISDYAKRSVYALKEMGLLSGMEDNRYMPKNAATRVQSAKLLYDVYSYITGTAREEIEAYGSLYKKLSAIGLVNIKKNAQAVVSRGEFAGIMASFMNKKDNAFSDGSVMYADVPQKSICYDDVMFLCAKNIISGDMGLFRPDDPITVSEAMSAAVKALGYGELMKIEGITDYYSAAIKYKLIKDGFGAADSAMDFETVMKLIDCIKDVNIVKADLSGAAPSYAVTEETALYYYHNILTVKGVLRSAGIRAVDGGERTNNAAAGIGGEMYMCTDSEIYRLLGYGVNGYYSENDETLLYAEDDGRNAVLTVSAEQFDSFMDSELYYHSGSSKRSVKIPKSARLMKNYNYISKLSDENCKNAEEIILIDNDNDGAYDAVNLITEENCFVSQISADNGTIYDYYENMPIVPDGNTVFNVYDSNGNAISIKNIAVNDVLSVQRDEENESCVIYVSRRRDDGAVKETGTEKGKRYARIGDNKYIAADNVMNTLSELNKLSAGNGVTVYLNYRNKIAHVLYNYKFSDYSYGYVINTMESDSGEELLIKVYTSDGELENIELTSKAAVNGNKVTTAAELEEVLKKSNTDTSSVNQLIKFRKNSDGKVRNIDTADYVDDANLYADTSSFTRYRDLTDSYYHMLYKAYVGYVRMAEDTLIINVPPDKSDMNDKSAYGITPFANLTSGTHKRVEIYNMSQDKTAGIAVIHSETAGGSELNSNSTAMVIKNIGELLKDRETRTLLTVLYNGEEKEYIMAENCPLEREYSNNGKTAVSVLEKGDVIRAGFNGRNEISDYHKIFDLSNDDDPTVVSRGFEADGAAEYYGSKRNLIAYSGNAENGNDDVRCGRLWEGNNNSAWFPGVRCSFEFGYAKEVHNNTVILGVYPGSDADNKGSADRYLNLKNRRVYIIDEVNGEVKLGTPEDIIPAQYAGESGASRIIAERHSDVASCIIIVKRR